MDAAARTDPPLEADEPTMLRAFLDYHRDTLRWKVDGLTQQQLAQTLEPSSMTLGGMVKHLALVESNWFEVVLLGAEAEMPPFDTVDWDADNDWDWHSAAHDSPEELMALFDDALARADKAIDEALAKSGLDTPSVRPTRAGDRHFSLRWILLHMIEEYARHNGHADLIRESIDGETGE
jgi:uncharacterized damage-inducible protein DinB